MTVRVKERRRRARVLRVERWPADRRGLCDAPRCGTFGELRDAPGNGDYAYCSRCYARTVGEP